MHYRLVSVYALHCEHDGLWAAVQRALAHLNYQTAEMEAAKKIYKQK